MFSLKSAAFRGSGRIPERYAEDSVISPPLQWDKIPKGTKSFALAVTDPDFPKLLKIPRVFALWMVYNIPTSVKNLPEGASPGGIMPVGSQELNSDFVTLAIPGYGKGYGAPWPFDAAHRYVFTLYALKEAELSIPESADYVEFIRNVLPVTITCCSLIGCYGPAKEPPPGS